MLRICLFCAVVFLYFSCSVKLVSTPFEEETSHLRDPALKPFYHGVASGDPYPTSVILWTRVTPEKISAEIEVKWELTEDEAFKKIVDSGVAQAKYAGDYTVKVEARGLRPGQQYYYRFHALDGTSIIGKTRSAAQSAQQLRLAAVSCSNYESGYFNAYARLAEEEDLSAVIHLGDYIYEYGPSIYADTTLGRSHLPEHEIITLKDYRTRYAQYRLDPGLRAAHASHPFITVWDDHELTNNSYKKGAQNHQDDEGNYNKRKKAARQAYYEWLPIRDEVEHYRNFSFGNMADLIMLDERLAGRTEQPETLEDPAINKSSHTMLGQKQLKWFEEQLTTSAARWKIIGNQVIFSYLNWAQPNFSINLDSWDGYPEERDKIADLIRGENIQNVVFLTGDTHSTFAFEVTHEPFENYDRETGVGAYAIEFGTTSLSSGNSNEWSSDAEAIALEQLVVSKELNPHLHYANLRDHGYLIVTFTQSEVRADFKFVPTVAENVDGIRTGKTYTVRSGEVKLREVLAER